MARSALETQALHYWNMMQRAPLDLPQSELREELDVIGQITESPVLKDLCIRNQGRFNWYRPARAVAR